MAKTKAQPDKPERLKIMVSSSVHGIQSLLQQIYAQLDGYGYEVWMSAMGTVPIFSDNHAFDDCLAAVQRCDLFLCLITPRYGSTDGTDPGITHQELDAAIQRKVPRWVMVHERVTLARSFFNKLGYKSIKDRQDLMDWLGFSDPDQYKEMLKRESNVIDDFRVVDMFDIASQQNIALADRQGNWVQPYLTEEDVKRYVNAQFGDYNHIARQLQARKAKTSKKKKAAVKKRAVKKRAPVGKRRPRR